MLKVFKSWFWRKGLDMFLVGLGSFTMLFSIPKHDVYFLIIGLWLITIPTFMKNLSLLVEQGHIQVMSQMAQIIKMKEDFLSKEAEKAGCDPACTCTEGE